VTAAIEVAGVVAATGDIALEGGVAVAQASSGATQNAVASDSRYRFMRSTSWHFAARSCRRARILHYASQAQNRLVTSGV